ncbi:MAG: hypothetical protein COW84_12230 [Gammaproteobacteria bacterium CG22_combo_CG10-13_8_21_14_all_40_8]|nr:MAG: hypothetical protein COW84_12230 [Gammaproteobacteria bacterium CG22_combo_CG10-13_8_21_14_all_40_8]
MSWLHKIKSILIGNQEDNISISPEIAGAVLLFEVMKMDEMVTQEEEERYYERLQYHFKQTKEDVKNLAQQAEVQLESATDYHQLIRALNEQMTISQKVELLQSMWDIALADGVVAAEERHLIRKIADLLHLRESEIIEAKTAAIRRYNRQRHR